MLIGLAALVVVPERTYREVGLGTGPDGKTGLFGWVLEAALLGR